MQVNEAGEVFSELRVDREFRGDVGTPLTKLRIIYNGISANTWLSPIGLSIKKEQPPPQIHDDLRSVLRERAQSAQGIMGRRHFEIERQELSRNEILQGTRVRKVESGSPSEPFRIFSTAPERSSKTPTRSKRVPETRRCLSTSSNYIVKRPVTAHPSLRKADLPDINIKPISAPEPLTARSLPAEGEKHQKNLRHSEPDMKSRLSIEKHQRVADDPNFRSFSAMKDAYDKRVRTSTIKSLEKLDRTLNDSKNDEILLRREKTEPILDENRSYAYRGLKPLMYNEESEYRHGPQCNSYKCIGCFRACLASDQYIQNLKSGNNPPRTPMPVNGRPKVSTKLRPALRMAFLEQQVSKADDGPEENKEKQDSDGVNNNVTVEAIENENNAKDA